MGEDGAVPSFFVSSPCAPTTWRWCAIRVEETRVNQRIRARSIRLIGVDGEQIGIVSVDEGLRLAREQELDLVEVAPQASPPVCRIMDYGKYKYEQSKRAKEARKHQHTIVVKEMKFRPKTEEHDYQFKLNHIQKFLAEGNKAKITVMFRGREMVHTELGRRVLERLVQDTQDMASVEQQPKLEGRNMTLVLVPKH
ncbi:MAG: translation initiation factor IF-3 [Candidatus Abyssobacteria bacterium SURF_17]|uniref:Translation initiation factor IF-3 n=1 Tax=Candidatus Abyssobacteria bacterium SURF_17 TaxID=2093361 RepID=A0A419F864_9BACT|nr:MAG: translation initiation factor IF-3 [Candidatus Abyssubacteria bacterium SURF_17]